MVFPVYSGSLFLVLAPECHTNPIDFAGLWLVCGEFMQGPAGVIEFQSWEVS